MDALDLIEHINYNGGKQVDYAYNKTGDLVKMEDWSGTTTYEVDLLHQLTATTDRLGKHVAYTYDGVGNQTSVSYPDGTTAIKEYDLVHNLTTVIEEDGRTTSYTYDGMRRVTHMDYPDGWQEDYHYDSIGQLLAIEDTDPTQKDMKQQKNTFEYDVCGNMIHEYMRGNGTGETTTDVTYTYDELHRVTSAKELYGNAWRNYQYDSLSNLTYEDNSNLVHYDYKLNNLNQVTEKHYSTNDKEGTLYTYDKRGNLVKEEYGKLNGNENGQKRQTVSEYTYDETNKMVKGVNSIGESSSYLFNGRNALVEQTWHIAKNGYGYHDVDAGLEEDADTSGKSGNGSGGKGHGNGNGQGNGNGAGDKPTGTLVGDFSTVVKQFVIDYTVETMDPLMEHEVNGLDYRYVYGNERLSVNISPIPNGAGHVVESGTVGQQIRLYYHQDLRGTVDYLTSPVSQKVESWTHYNEWGEITHNAVLKTGYRELDLVKNYTGHEFDAVLNMYYAKARMYDAENRRFVSIDPILDGTKYDLSEYTNDPVRFVQYPYVRDNPLIYVDPLGLREFEDDPKDGFVSKKTAQEIKYAAQAAKQPVLQYGRTGNDVYELQRKLAKAGYYHYTEIDGSFGPKTDAAVREFQKINGLDVDGSVGPKTWTKLLAETYKQGVDKQNRHSAQRMMANEIKQINAVNKSASTQKPNNAATTIPTIPSYQGNNTPAPVKDYYNSFHCPEYGPVQQWMIDTTSNAMGGFENFVDHLTNGLATSVSVWGDRFDAAMARRDLGAVGEATVNILTFGAWDGFWTSAAAREQALKEEFSAYNLANFVSLGLVDTFGRPLFPQAYGIEPNSEEHWETFYGTLLTEVGLLSAAKGIQSATVDPQSSAGLAKIAQANEAASQAAMNQVLLEEKITNMEWGTRPDPSTYLSQEYINHHLAMFKGGVSKFIGSEPKGTIGKDALFVLPKEYADQLVIAAGGSVDALTDALGLPRGYLGTNPYRVDIPIPQGLRLPSGNEMGAFGQPWVAGGFTIDGLPEAVINPAEVGTYIGYPVWGK